MKTRFSPQTYRALFTSIFVVLIFTLLSFNITAQPVPEPTPAAPTGFRGVQPVATGVDDAPSRDASSTPDLGLLHQDNFDDTNSYLSAWLPDPGWSLVPSNGGQVVQISRNGRKIQFIVDSIDDIVVSARLQVGGGAAELRLRDSDAGFYAVRLIKRGEVQLLRNNDVLATVPIPKIKHDKWRKLRVSIIGDMIRVTVNKTEVIAIQDPNPLPAGKFVIAKRGKSSAPLLIDDVSIWLPRIDIPWLRTEAENEAIDTAARQIRSSVEIFDGDEAALIAALVEANPEEPAPCPTEASEIILAPNGTYDLYAIYSLSESPWGNEGLPRIRCNVIINGQGATISRPSDAFLDFRIFSVSSATGRLTLNEVTLTGGKATESGGSAIYSNGGSVYLDNATITGNTTVNNSFGNGGVGIFSIFGILDVTNSTISDNHMTSPAYSGGGISVCAGSANISTSLIQGNSATVGGGIAICYLNSTVTISDTQILENSAGGGGGGISVSDGLNTAPQVNIVDTVIENNTAIYGGGLYYLSSAVHSESVTIEDSIFHNNSAIQNGTLLDGGAIAANLNLVVTGSCFVGNSATSVDSVFDWITPIPPDSITLTGNWWGATNGPSGVGPGSGDSVNGNSVYSNWLTSRPSYCPQQPRPAIPVEFDPNFFSERTLDDCTANYQDQQELHCWGHVSVLSLIDTLEANNIVLTHQALLEALIEGEYRSSIGYDSEIGTWGNEAVARQFYSDCGEDGCQGVELYFFLDYFQSPGADTLDDDYLQVLTIRRDAQPPQNTYWQGFAQELQTAVSTVLTPADPAWVNGPAPGKPYGYGTRGLEVWVNVTDAQVDFWAAKCGFAARTVNDGGEPPTMGQMFIGTTQETDKALAGVCSWND